MEIDELKERLVALKQRGFVASMRRGNTGIGYTLETLLGVRENNLRMPDLGDIELKAHRKGISTPITLFTFNSGVWKIHPRDVIKRYGYIDEKGRLALKCFVRSSPNNQGLYLQVGDDGFRLHNTDGSLIAEWPIQVVLQRFRKKMPTLVTVHAETRKTGRVEEFRFDEAYYLSNPDSHNFLKLIQEGQVVVDIRMHLNPNSSVRNRGTAFRIDESSLGRCFGTSERLI